MKARSAVQTDPSGVAARRHLRYHGFIYSTQSMCLLYMIEKKDLVVILSIKRSNQGDGKLLS